MRRPCSGLAFSCRNWPWTARCVNGAIPTHRWRCSAAQRSAGSCRRSTQRHALGLKPGQSLIAAQALSRDFATAEYDLAAVERWQAFLAAWAYGFSSQVSLHYPRALLLEVQSSLALFGPWPRFEARLRKELTALGFRHRLCGAEPGGGEGLANSHDGLAIEDETALQRQLSALPLDRTGLSRELAVALGRMGLRHLRQVLELPRAALARRFPAELLLHIDRLCGRSPLALEHYRPPDTFDLRIELNSTKPSNT